MKAGLSIVRNKLDKSILIHNADIKSTFSLIWLHGLGDSSEGFLDFFCDDLSPINVGARVKLIQAPVRPVTINGGAPCTSWYDITSLDFKGVEKERYSLPQLNESLQILSQHVKEEAEQWKDCQEDKYKRVFVGGFSQGCAVALTYALSAERVLGGGIGLSGHLFGAVPFLNDGKVPLLINHGKYDNMIPYQLAIKSYQPVL